VNKEISYTPDVLSVANQQSSEVNSVTGLACHHLSADPWKNGCWWLVASTTV